MILRMASLLVALCLLASAATAHAECAWVLWSNFISSNAASSYAPSTGGLWIPESAGTRTECERSRDRMPKASVAGEAMGPGTQPTESSGRASMGGAVGVVGPNGQIIWTCLPDIIDPRGPKGK